MRMRKKLRLKIRQPLSEIACAIRLLLPHKCVEHSFRVETKMPVKLHGASIGLSDGEREEREGTLPKIRGCRREKRLADSMRTEFWQHADLGDMANVMANSRAKN